MLGDDHDGLDRLPVRTVKIGPFHLSNDGATLVLRLEERGELSFNGCLVISLLLGAVLLFGVLAIYQFASATATPVLNHTTLREGPAQILAPSQNQFGLLWLFSALGVLIAIPFYVARTYKSALMYTFSRSNDVLLRNNRVVTQLRRIEHLAIQEMADPDGRYLYNLEIVYGDGLRLELHCSYDEREIKNVANEVARFADVRVAWRE